MASGKKKNNFNAFLCLAIFLGFLFFIFLFITSDVKKRGVYEDLTPFYVFLWITGIITIGFIVGCILTRGELKNKEPKPLAQTGGALLSGLPIPAAVSVSAFLYPNQIKFIAYLNFSETRQQEFVLKLEKVIRVEKLFSIGETNIVSSTGQLSSISSSNDTNGNHHDILLIEYLDNGQKKQILLRLPIMVGTSKFIKTIEKLNPSIKIQQSQTTEL